MVRAVLLDVSCTLLPADLPLPLLTSPLMIREPCLYHLERYRLLFELSDKVEKRHSNQTFKNHLLFPIFLPFSLSSLINLYLFT